MATNEAFAFTSWNTALYIRLSRDDGRDESLSVTHQRTLLQDFLNSRNDLRFFDFYIDDGHTGTDFERPEFQRMFADIRLGKVNCVLVKDLSRLGRNYIETGNYMENVFPQYHVRFISVTDHLDSVERPSDMNSLIVPIKNIINDDYCRQASEKIRAVADMKRKNGEFIGSFAPYGYQKSSEDKHRLVPDPDASEIVRSIFQWYLDGMSKRGIAGYLNELGIPSPAEYKRRKGLRYQACGRKLSRGLWCPQTIGGILENEVYIGNLIQGRYRVLSYKDHRQVQTSPEEWFAVPDTHEAIVSKKIFEAAKRLSSQVRTRTPPQQKQVYLFSGLLKCGDCHHSMNRKTGGGGRIYYICKTYKEYSRDACSPHTIPHIQLEESVSHTIWLLVTCFLNTDTCSLTEKNFDAQKSSFPLAIPETKRLQKILDEKKYYRKSLYEDWKRGDLSHEDYLFLKEQYAKEETRLTEQITYLENKQAKNQVFLSPAVDSSKIPLLERGILTGLINYIEIHSNKRIHIHFQACNPLSEFFATETQKE